MLPLQTHTFKLVKGILVWDVLVMSSRDIVSEHRCSTIINTLKKKKETIGFESTHCLWPKSTGTHFVFHFLPNT